MSKFLDRALIVYFGVNLYTLYNIEKMRIEGNTKD